jgi:hypothetical protein
MTLAEVKRAVKSRIRVKKMEAKERATFDYILANLIGASVGCVLDSNTTFPPIEEVYGSLFEDEVKKKEEAKIDKQTQLFIARLKAYANFHNKKFNKEVAKDSE